MDSFIDKNENKANAAEMIKANSEAEARQIEELKSQKEELEKAVSEMRRLNLKCVETNELTNQLIQGAIEKIEQMQSKAPVVTGEAEGDDSEEDYSETLGLLRTLSEKLDKNHQEAIENIHLENVRVYRNVQASIIEELKQQSEALAIQHMHIEKKNKGIKPLAILAVVMSGLSFLAIVALIILAYLGIIF